MVNDERPATFQIPGSGTLKDHVQYHRMLLKEFRHTMVRASQVPPLNPVHGKRVKACQILKRRLNLHYVTAKKQLDLGRFLIFDYMVDPPV